MADPTGEDVSRRVRDLVQDSRPPMRYDVPMMTDAINDALERMKELRPDRFVTWGFEPGRVVSLSDPLNVPWALVHPMALYAAGILMLQDDEFADDGRASQAMQRAAGMVTGRVV